MPATRPRVFISYHHRCDQAYYDQLSTLLQDVYECIQDNSLERAVQSDDIAYVRRRISEAYITGSSCTLVLCGAETWRRRYVDWEIAATLDKQHGLIGVWLPTLPLEGRGTNKPARLQANLDSGYASWHPWRDIVASSRTVPALVAEACARSNASIRNGLPLQQRNL